MAAYARALTGRLFPADSVFINYAYFEFTGAGWGKGGIRKARVRLLTVQAARVRRRVIKANLKVISATNPADDGSFEPSALKRSGRRSAAESSGGGTDSGTFWKQMLKSNISIALFLGSLHPHILLLAIIVRSSRIALPFVGKMTEVIAYFFSFIRWKDGLSAGRLKQSPSRYMK